MISGVIGNDVDQAIIGMSEHGEIYKVPVSKSIYQNNSVMPAKAGIQNYLK
jgi:hypothetical protein